LADNVSLETDAADNWKPSKKRSRDRIDEIVAMIMGLSLAQDNPETEATPWGFYVSSIQARPRAQGGLEGSEALGRAVAGLPLRGIRRLGGRA
jgi:hypothetical protein